MGRKKTENPMVTTSFRCLKSELDFLDSHGIKVADAARYGVQLKIKEIKKKEQKRQKLELELLSSHGIKDSDAFIPGFKLKTKERQAPLKKEAEMYLPKGDLRKRIEKIAREISYTSSLFVSGKWSMLQFCGNIDPAVTEEDIKEFFEGRKKAPSYWEIVEFCKIKISKSLR
ncbi:TPA: hypothetical protein HA351_05360 [Methanosarcinaceae archaeon]|nr:hypothetical protein [Methanosarcinaceae archaeon]